MWMHYSSESNAPVENLLTSVERLSNQLYDLSWEYLHAANYNFDYCFDDDGIRSCMDKSELFNLGGNLCSKYCYGILELEELCELLVRMDLKRFLYQLAKYLPEDIIHKYELHEAECINGGIINDNDNDDNETGDTNTAQENV